MRNSVLWRFLISTVGLLLGIGVGLWIVLYASMGNSQAAPQSVMTNLQLTPSKISAGEQHTCVVVNGAAQCWGNNNDGQLGVSSTIISTSTPITVTGLYSGVTDIVVGQNHTCAIVNGGVKCWGENHQGQLGNGTNTASYIPVDVIGLTNGVSAITAGESHNCAIVNGNAKCWGYNFYGQLGNNSRENKNIPETVIGLSSGVTAIIAGTSHTCAIINNSIRCWGSNGYGQLGNNSRDDGSGITIPVTVTGWSNGPSSQVSAIALGHWHTCAIVDQGIKCWGYGVAGQLGLGREYDYKLSPTLVMSRGVSAISAAGEHTCAIVNTEIKCWGKNDKAQLGIGSYENMNLPTYVVDIDNPVHTIATGYYSTCAIVNKGVMCWGDDTNKQLGVEGPDVPLPRAVNTFPITQRDRILTFPQPNDRSLDSPDFWVEATLNSRQRPYLNSQSPNICRTEGALRVFLLKEGTCIITAFSPETSYGFKSGVISVTRSFIVKAKQVTNIEPLHQATAIALGGFHSCAIVNGGVMCWGYNGRGQLGIDIRNNRAISSPLFVDGASNGASAIAAGNEHTCAILGGVVKCWGDNTFGQLAENTLTHFPTPTAVSGLGDEASAIAAGYGHTCVVIKGSGGVKCWGKNDKGQLGNGTLALVRVAGFFGVPTPVSVSNLSGVSAIALGRDHSCAIVNGGLKCWGDNDRGQLGTGNRISSTTPVNVPGYDRDVSAIFAGGYSTCAVVSNNVKCWGELDVLATYKLKDSSASGSSGVAIGRSHRCELKNNNVLCLGKNNRGQLGIGFNSNLEYLAGSVIDSILNLLPHPISNVTAISAGYDHTCAIIQNGVKCWGDNTYGQLGFFDGFNSSPFAQTVSKLYPIEGLPPAPSPPIPAPPNPSYAISAITAGGYGHSCALIQGGVRCWGQNTKGQLGDGSIIDRSTPVTVSVLTPGGSVVAAGVDQTCAIVNSEAWCWGDNSWNQFANGTGVNSRVPLAISSLGSGVTAIATSGSSVCAVITGGAKCWGYNGYGQIGIGSTNDRVSTPTAVVGLDKGVTAITTSGGHSCALVNGGVKCWGKNNDGQLGNGNTQNSNVPVDVLGLGPGSGVTAISANGDHTCAIVKGNVKCWGLNNYGQLGDGSYGSQSSQRTPVNVTGIDNGLATVVSAGATHTCAVVNAAALCWGHNATGQLGNGNTEDKANPVSVSGLNSGVRSIAVSASHTCAIVNDNVMCWGNNTSGQLGAAQPAKESNIPITVNGLLNAVTRIFMALLTKPL